MKDGAVPILFRGFFDIFRGSRRPQKQGRSLRHDQAAATAPFEPTPGIAAVHRTLLPFMSSFRTAQSICFHTLSVWEELLIPLLAWPNPDGVIRFVGDRPERIVLNRS